MKKFSKKLIAFLVCSVILMYSVLSAPTVINAASPSMQGPYLICSKLDLNMVVDIHNADFNNGTDINLYDINSSTAQIFYINRESDGYYSIRSYANTNMVLDIWGGTAYDSAEVKLGEYNGRNNQLWSLQKINNNKEYYIKSKCGDFYLDVRGGNTYNGTQIQVYHGNGTNAQIWKFRTNYSLDRACEYAIKYSSSNNPYNTSYAKFTKDCTNFVSQCLYRGGITETHNWTRILKSQKVKDVTGGVAWSQAKSLFLYLVNDLHYSYEKVYDLSCIRQGDVVFMDTNGDKNINHSTICTQIGNDGIPRYCAHTSLRQNFRYDRATYSSAYVVHIPH